MCYNRNNSEETACAGSSNSGINSGHNGDVLTVLRRASRVSVTSTSERESQSGSSEVTGTCWRLGAWTGLEEKLVSLCSSLEARAKGR